jgi:hypothetical protein
VRLSLYYRKIILLGYLLTCLDHDFRPIVRIISDVVLIDPFQVRPGSLVQGIDVFARSVSGPGFISTDEMIEIKADIAGNPVAQSPFGLVELAVVTPLPISLKELICDFLFREAVFILQDLDLVLDGAVKSVFVLPVG